MQEKEIRFHQFPMWSLPSVFQTLLWGFWKALKILIFPIFKASQFPRFQNDTFTTRDCTRDVSLRRRHLILLLHYRRNFCAVITGFVYQIPLNITQIFFSSTRIHIKILINFFRTHCALYMYCKLSNFSPNLTAVVSSRKSFN